ncbi:MAG: catechol 1,2-dioxygenase [Caulobacteraceae bacterium]
MSSLMQSQAVQRLLERVAGLDQPQGDPRTKQIVRRIVSDLYTTIDDFDVSPEEFWSAVSFLQQAAPEFGLVAPGLGFDHYLDLRMDAEDQRHGREGGTPRTIEGPLYVAGAPLSKGSARLDDGQDKGETLVMYGRVVDTAGEPIEGAIVDVWHANTLGGYSYFDPSQSAYNNRRRIETDHVGRYRFQSILPSGYAVPADGSTETLLKTIGRHGHRPAHIHFFVSAPGHRHLTTQINIDGDPYLHDDFAHATRDELIATAARREDPEQMRAAGLNEPFSEIEFDFVLFQATTGEEALLSLRPRVEHS